MAINLLAPNKRGKHTYHQLMVALLLNLLVAFSGCQINAVQAFAQSPRIQASTFHFFHQASTTRASAPATAKTKANAISVYHEGWDLVNKLYIDTDKLAAVNWSSLEHAHDAEIQTVADAGKFLTLELKNLHTIYTRYLTPKQAEDQNNMMVGEIGGIGITFPWIVAKVENGQKIYLGNADGFPEPARDADGYPVIEKVFLGTPAAQANLLPGDAVVTVDGKSTKTLSTEGLSDLIQGQPGTTVELQFVRQGKLYKTSMARTEIETAPIYVRNLPNDILYIRIVSFMSDKVSANFLEILEQHKTAKGLIIDLRGNRGGLLDSSLEMAAYLLPRDKNLLRVEFRSEKGTIKEKLHFKEEKFKDPDVTKNIPIVLLVNEESASGSEVFAGALVDNDRADLVGTKTFGKGCVQQIRPIQDGRGGAINITYAKYFTPKGTCPGDGETILTGLVPKPENIIKLSAPCHLIEDVVGSPTTVDLAKDLQLARAIAVIVAKLIAAGGR